MNSNFYELKKILESNNFDINTLIHSTTGDGRLESAESEALIPKYLKTLYKDIKVIEAPKERYWYDILIEYKNEKYPINIKMTGNSKSADNVSSKVGMFYALTGIWPEEVKGLNTWASFNEKLTENFDPKNDSDYYFLVCFKETGEFLFTSLKQIETLVPNGNNLPFQCNWNSNIIPTKRSNEEQSYYIINTFIESFIRKTYGLDILINWRNVND